MKFVIARCALGSIHYLEMKKIHDCQCLIDDSPALAVEQVGLGESVYTSNFSSFRVACCIEHITIAVFFQVSCALLFGTLQLFFIAASTTIGTLGSGLDSLLLLSWLVSEQPHIFCVAVFKLYKGTSNLGMQKDIFLFLTHPLVLCVQAVIFTAAAIITLSVLLICCVNKRFLNSCAS